MKKTGLIIEGGGLRGLFASGVLDVFIDHKIKFPYVNSVSFGSVNAFSYISRQRGRTKKIMDDYINDPRYMGFGNLVKEGNLIGTEFVYKTVPDELNIFDMDTFRKSKTIFHITATDCITGKPEYFEKSELDKEELLEALRASSSLPFISKMVPLRNSLYLDGGLSDSIPVKKSIEEGFRKNIVILTRDRAYRKKPEKFKSIIRWAYRKHPKVADSLISRHRKYNETLDFIDELEKKGEALVIRPETELKAGRLEKDLKVLDSVYRHGIEVGEKKLKEIKNFIK